MCELKTCKTCNIEFPATAEFFHYRNDTNKLQPRCRTCLNKSKCSGKLAEHRIKVLSEVQSGHLTCKMCKTKKTLSEFNIAKNKLSGHRAECRQCESNKNKKDWENNRLKSREKSTCKSFNITQEKYQILMSINNCQLCNREFKPISEHYKTDRNIDHCHSTGKIRGVLCVRCNVALGTLGDNVEGLEKALKYLKSDTYGDI